MTTTSDFIAEHIDSDALADYLTADWGCWLALWRDGSYSIMDLSGSRLGPGQAERIVGMVKCPGIANADMTYWRSGWDCSNLSDAEVIRSCCQDGDVVGELEDLRAAIAEDAEDD